jgi:hypothetical protein
MREDRGLRGLALYNWSEDFDLSDHRDFLLSLVQDAKVDPTKLEFEIGKDKRKRATVRKNLSAADAIKAAPPFKNFEFCRPIGGNYLRLESDMSVSLASYGKSYRISHSPEVLTVKDVVRHVSLFSRHMTPQYGFSTVMHDTEVVWLMGGAGTSGMSSDQDFRAAVIARYERRNVDNPSYSGLVDIFEVNVLTTAHLTRQVFGQSLASWIRNGNNGELIEINSKVAVWIVPDDIRPRVCQLFFHAKLTEVAVEPLIGRDKPPATWTTP